MTKIMKFLPVFIFVMNVLGQALQNIMLPMFLSGSQDLFCVFLIYATFVYFLFFAMLDVILDLIFKNRGQLVHPQLSEPLFALAGIGNALNGAGSVFGGSPKRLPLTLQMAFMMFFNLLSPFMKLKAFALPTKPFWFNKHLWSAGILFLLSAILVTVDKVQHGGAGSFSPFGLLFIVGALAGVFYNIVQEKFMFPLDFQKMDLVTSLRISVKLLRKQLTWCFIFCWISVPLAMISGMEESGFSRIKFEASWGHLLPFGNIYMNLFNLGYIICFVTGIFMNHYDSSFNILTSNISSILSLWTGWVPSMMMITVGFVPSYGLTISAIFLSIMAIYPSYKYSLTMREEIAEAKHQATFKSQNRIPLLGGTFHMPNAI
jgi:hypothetical protein